MPQANQQHYRTLILASLLHDIGKLLNKPQPQESKKHAVYGQEFLQEQEISDLLRTFAQDIDVELLRYLVLRHDPFVETDWRLPRGNPLLRIIRAADGFSAGERSLEQLYGQPPTGELALDSIFTYRYLGRKLDSDNRRHYRPTTLTPDAAFPDEGVEPLSNKDYQDTISGFKAAYQYALNEANGDWTQLEAWTYSLLERYTWAVPSALNKTPRDVSLFDHARTSCAIAAALYLYRHTGLQKKRPQFLLIKGDVSGIQDYIYSVANVGSGGVAKRLRARSFFVTALTEAVAHRLRDDLVPDFPLPIAANVFNGGGQFVLLAPNLQAVHDNLAAIEKEVNTWLWQEFQGDLAFVFACEPVSGKELAIKPGKKGRTINQALVDLEQKVEQAKAHRLGALLQQEGRWQPAAFVWTAQRFDNGDCPSCRRLPARAGDIEPSLDQRLCRRCYRDRELSEQIVKARYVAYWRGESPQRNGQPPKTNRLLTLFQGETRRHLVLLPDLAELEKFDRPPYQLDGFGYDPPLSEDGRPAPPVVRHFANHVPHFDTLDDLEKFCTAERGCVYDRYFNDDRCGILVRPDPRLPPVGPDDYPILQTFGCLAAASAEHNGKMGAQLLGILRADVDNLRLLFSDSFEEKVRFSKEGQETAMPVRSLSRLATLSRMMDLFFSGWVHQSLSNPPYERIYTVYSGGDDLCLVGPWDVLIDFTRHLAAEFDRYVGHNPNVTLSAALTVTKPKFPIATSARRTGKLLDAAKNAGRSRLNLFGVVTRWRTLSDYEKLDPDLAKQLKEQEKQANLRLEQLWEWAALLDEQLSHYRAEKEARRRYPISPAFAHRLLRYAEMARHWTQAEEIKAGDMLYMARLAYDLGRNVVKSGAVPEEVEQRLLELTQFQNKELMAGMRLPVTYALYRNRERRVDDGR